MRNLERSAKLDDAADRLGIELHKEQLDITDPSSRTNAIERIIAKHGGIDVLVNNAGYAVYGPFEYCPPEDVELMFQTNVLGTMEITRLVLDIMRRQGRGSIINVSSTMGVITMPLLSTYSATKFAVVGWSDALRAELRPMGIQVCSVEPGTVETDFLGRSMVRYAPRDDDHVYRRYWYGLERNMDPRRSILPMSAASKVASRIARLCFSRKLPAHAPIGLDAHLATLGRIFFGVTRLRSILARFVYLLGRQSVSTDSK